MSDETDETNDATEEEGDEAPAGRLQPPTEALSQVHTALAEGDYDEAVERIEETATDSPLEADWRDYFRGLTELGRGELEEAYGLFESTWTEIASAPAGEVDDERLRLAAKCLKKMGWYHRRNEAYEEAYAYHSMEQQLADRYGSPAELHDAALSLDVDAYFLGMGQMSRHWLEASIEAAEQIDDEVGRVKALGMSWNNLAGTLCDLEDFEAAGEAADNSVEHWSTYEELVGPQENRLVWAKHIVGDAYKRWGDYLVLQDEKATGRERLERAEGALVEAVEMADRREMSDEDREDIQGKLDAVRESLEELEKEVDDEESEDEEEAASGENEGEAEDEEQDNATAEDAEGAEDDEDDDRDDRDD